MNTEPALTTLEKLLCEAIQECDNIMNNAFAPNGNPDYDWCQSDTLKTNKLAQKTFEKHDIKVQKKDNNATLMGKMKDKCAQNKVRKERRKSSDMDDVNAGVEFQIPKEKGGGSIKPDVLVGSWPNDVQKVYDFKTSCPPSNKEKWGTYKGKNPNYNGQPQNEVYQELTGVTPKIIHPTAGICATGG